MGKARRVTLSAALIVFICFFLPWVQISCVGLQDSESGFDLARRGGHELWLVPLLMLVVVFLGLRSKQKPDSLFAIISMLSGILSLYLMDRERVDAARVSGLIAAHLTAWFWLGWFSSIALAVSALVLYRKRAR